MSIILETVYLGSQRTGAFCSRPITKWPWKDDHTRTHPDPPTKNKQKKFCRLKIYSVDIVVDEDEAEMASINDSAREQRREKMLKAAESRRWGRISAAKFEAVVANGQTEGQNWAQWLDACSPQGQEKKICSGAVWLSQMMHSLNAFCREANSPVVTPTSEEKPVESDVKPGCSAQDAAQPEPDSQGSLSNCSPTQEMDNSEPLFEWVGCVFAPEICGTIPTWIFVGILDPDFCKIHLTCQLETNGSWRCSQRFSGRLDVIFSSDIDWDEVCEPEIKTLVMPTKSGRTEKITFRVGGLFFRSHSRIWGFCSELSELVIEMHANSFTQFGTNSNWTASMVQSMQIYEHVLACGFT